MATGRIDEDALKRLLALIGDDPDDLDELIDDYLEAAPELAKTIAESGAKQDVDAMRVAAHTLKSNARDLGALRLSELASAVENACKSSDIDAAITAASCIEVEEAAASEVLSRLKAEGFGRT